MARTHARLFSLLLLLATFTAWAFGPFGGSGPDPLKGLTLDLTSRTLWAADGSALIDSELRVHNGTDSVLEGELRLVPMALNGRIDFDRVSVERLDAAAASEVASVEEESEEAASEPEPSGFYVLPVLRLAVGERQAFRFRVSLPPGSRQPNVPLQLFALYRGARRRAGSARRYRCWRGATLRKLVNKGGHV